MLLALAVLASAFLSISWLAASRLVCPARQPLEGYHREILDHAGEHGMRVEPFTVRDREGFDVPCLLCEPMKNPGAAIKGNKLRDELKASGVALGAWGEVRATLVLLHGHNGRKEDHLPVAERFCAAGLRCILIDLPGHGEHPAPFASFGFREKTLPGDVLRAAAARFAFDAQPAALFGISQGGAIALQAAALADENWFAVAELSSFAALDDVIAEQAALWFGPLQSPARVMVHWLVGHRAKFRPEDVRPVDAAASLATMPVLIGHGDADAFIAPDHARRLFAATPGKRKLLLNIPGANHHNVLITSAPVYATASEFFLDALTR